MSDNLPPLPALPPPEVEEWSESFITFRGEGWKKETVEKYAQDYARAAIEANTPAVPASASVPIDYRQAVELVEMFGGEPAEVRLIHGDGHSGPGLYAYYDELPEEGANFLGETDPDASPQPQPVAQPVQAQLIERCPNCDDTGDVNSIDGEWRGVCYCPAGKSINAQANPSTDSIVQAAVIRALDEANVRNEVLRGMCIEVALEKARDMLEGLK
ncbi:MAG: hypothetical protein WC829_03160 [Hyphomicrobium sp.]|jgi:hypothetical protein